MALPDHNTGSYIPCSLWEACGQQYREEAGGKAYHLLFLSKKSYKPTFPLQLNS